MMNLRSITCFILLYTQIHAFPADTQTAQTVGDQSLVVSTDIPLNDEPVTGEKEAGDAPSVPKIYELNIRSNITNRFAQNTVHSKVRNLGDKARETTFSVILPETAYITGFVMEIGGKNYTAYVKEKEEAKAVYDQAVASGYGAAHVAATARDSNRFTVSVNIEAKSKAAFYLSYEQLLKRESGQYEMVINIHPEQPVKDLNVEVNIAETRPLKFVRTPAIRSGNEISTTNEVLDPHSLIDQVNDTSATIKFKPNLERQKELAEGLGTDKDKGFSGQFVIQYDVERDPKGGEILLKDGYFVHFFAPSDIVPLPKYVVFVLDTSGSMYDEKLNQLKVAMKSILGELKETDLFNIVEFNTHVNVWDINSPKDNTIFPKSEGGGYDWYSGPSNQSLEDIKFPPSYAINKDNLEKANEAVAKMESNGGTNIYEALRVALKLIERQKIQNGATGPQPMVIFLTDGDPTVGVTGQSEITSKITELNKLSTPIFSLSFGQGADRRFLEKISLENNGFARHIYEGSDASIQLEDFYKTISSPLLSNVEFKYTEEATALTKTKFPLLFLGGEFIVAGKIDEGFSKPPQVSGTGIGGPIILIPEVVHPITGLERLWAYLTVQQLLQAAKAEGKKKVYEDKALEIALKYSFVTSVSSLVVVKPNDTKAIDTEAADTPGKRHFAMSSAHRSTSSFRNSGIRGGAGYSNFALASLPSAGFGGGAGAAGFSAVGGAGFGGPLYASTPYLLARPQQSFAAPGPPPAFEQTEEDADFLPESSYDTIQPLIVSGQPAGSTTTIPPHYFTTQVEDDTTKLDDLKKKLPWLAAILADDNKTLTSPAGGYTLGLNEKTLAKIDCPLTPLNGTGHCVLLHECPQVHSLLTSVDVYQKYFCNINDKFAGVCCN